MDEPTSALTERERGAPVRDHSRSWQAQGKSILYITHKMEELFRDRG